MDTLLGLYLPAHYSILKQIGSGSFGDVFLALDTRSNTKIVVKSVDISQSSAKELESAKREAEVLCSNISPHLVRGIESVTTPDHSRLFIVMQYANRGDLHALIRSRRGRFFPEQQILLWLSQLASGLNDLHSRGMIHRDVKSQNIFVHADPAPGPAKPIARVLLGDMGIVRLLSPGSLAETFVGSPSFMAPEIMSGKPYGPKADVWALGCCCFELMCLRSAFSASNISALAVKIIGGKLPPFPTIYSESLQELCTSMLDLEPDHRPTARDILDHPLLSSSPSSRIPTVPSDATPRREPPPPARRRKVCDLVRQSIDFEMQRKPKEVVSKTPSASTAASRRSASLYHQMCKLVGSSTAARVRVIARLIGECCDPDVVLAASGCGESDEDAADRWVIDWAADADGAERSENDMFRYVLEKLTPDHVEECFELGRQLALLNEMN